ncbi:hypothetical protein MKW98_021884 [Papaver atlanticum]|uniref:Uncharacterized protein n=1 Tax=Papaver atlanticum TaxID=357466 RepID=A0AAD4TM00_9MAGN|nr:hypothetical protein MKW98_021884 [Papaver atlanticum]
MRSDSGQLRDGGEYAVLDGIQVKMHMQFLKVAMKERANVDHGIAAAIRKGFCSDD